MQTTIFNTPFLTPLLRGIAWLLLKIGRWTAKPVEQGQLSGPAVLVGAPHTSNWDFILMLCVALQFKLSIRWMGKASIFNFPFKPLMYWMGGIPIDRSKANNAVDFIVHEFERNPELIIMIPPEGTRSKVSRWKSGFYHVARLAQVPVHLIAIDGQNREVRFLGSAHPIETEELAVQKDIETIKVHYAGILGVRPNNT